jgi:hypothetical protein
VWRLRALARVNQEREALETWDPAMGAPGAAASAARVLLRHQLLAADREGHLRRARAAARRAKAAAQTGMERRRAAVLLITIEHELGKHGRELEQAQALKELHPDSSLAADMLRRALTCTGQQPWADQLSPAPRR